MSSFSQCFTDVVFRFDVFNVACVKLLVSKGLGYAIILGSILVKVPQIVKIVNAKSAQGINVPSIFLELCSITASFVYGYANGFPFSAYGESVFMTIQSFILAYLILHYSGNVQGCMMMSAGYVGILSFLLSPLAPMPLLWFLQALVVPNILIGRLLQASSNYTNGNTGQLSVVTTFLLVAGSLARIFTSYQETGDNILILTSLISFICNSIIFAQIMYYGGAKTQAPPRSSSIVSQMTN